MQHVAQVVRELGDAGGRGDVELQDLALAGVRGVGGELPEGGGAGGVADTSEDEGAVGEEVSDEGEAEGAVGAEDRPG